MGSNPDSPTANGNTCTTTPIHEGGIIVINLPAGRYIFLDRRDLADRFNIAAVRAFQSPNLLAYGATIIADYTPVTGYEKENLLTNFGVRTTRADLSPIIDATGGTDPSIESCY